LNIPHIKLHERAFVLQPLCDINDSLVHPVLHKTMNELLEALPREDKSAMRRVVPMGKDADGKTRMVQMPSINLRLNRPKNDLQALAKPTSSSISSTSSSSSSASLFQKGVLICGILNVTPDSFSDGGKHNASVEQAVASALQMLADGADMIDVGGESTRPGAKAVSVEDELARVLPVIKELKRRVSGEAPSSSYIPCIISIDTRNAQVARQAVLAGADVINDVSGGRYDASMLQTASSLGVPIVLMHSRGTPTTMNSLVDYTSNDASTPSSVTAVASKELETQITKANALLPRWLQLIDPGIGFAKKGNDNLLLLHPDSLAAFKHNLGGRAMMVGASRKRFLAETSASSSLALAQDRDFATAGAHCAALMGGADIVRVHNVLLAKQSLDALSCILNSRQEQDE